MVARLLLISFVLLLFGCQAADSTKTREVVGPRETIGIVADAPQLVDGRYQVDVRETLSEYYTPEQIADLPVGEMCTIDLTATGRVVTGKIANTSDEILVLTDAEEIIVGTSTEGVPMIEKIPYVTRMFKNVGVAVERRFLGSETISAFEISSIKVERQLGDEAESAAPQIPDSRMNQRFAAAAVSHDGDSL